VSALLFTSVCLLIQSERFGNEIFHVFVERHPNTSLHLIARTRGAFPKAVGAAGELVVTDNNKAIILEAKKS
jgi:hypothetical protein